MRFSSILLSGCLLLLSALPSQDIHVKEPNPYVDVTRYRVRGGNVSTTATTISGSPIVTLAAASKFQNGDGVTIYGAGATNTMSTPKAPTVTPSIARVMTGTGDVVNGRTGAKTYNYKIIARDIGGGYTAASSAGTTATGAASLGAQSVSIASASRSGATVTVTTSSAHRLAVGAMVILSGQSDTSFNGWYQVAMVPDNRHFTFTSGQTTANGASTSATGGTVFWFNCNHISWSAVTGAYQYYIYSDRAVPGTFALIGTSWPTNGDYTDGSLYFDDFGSTMTSNFTAYPASIPATAPRFAANDYLTTMIVSGAGTTTLTVATDAGQSVSDATILYDDAPNIKAAATAAGGIPIYFPFGVGAVVNSPLNLAPLNTPMVGGLTLNDVMLIGSSVKWDGNIFPVRSSAGQFTFQSYPSVGCNVSPCVHVTSNSAPYVAHLNFGVKGNGQVQMLVDGGGGEASGTYEYLYFGTNSNDYMNMNLVLRGVAGSTSAAGRFKAINFNGQQLGIGITATPAFYCDDCGQTNFESVFMSGRMLLSRPDPASMTFIISKGYSQGSLMPFLTVTGNRVHGGNTGVVVDLNNIILDTTSTPALTYLPSAGTATINAKLFDVGLPQLGTPQITGNALTMCTGCAGQNTGVIDGANFTDNTVSVVGAGSFGNRLLVPGAPTVNVVAGRNNAVGTYNVGLAWVDAIGNTTGTGAGGINLNIGAPFATFTLAAGNQNFNVVPPTPPAGAIGYYMFYSLAGSPSAGPLTHDSRGCGTAIVTPATATANNVILGNCGSSLNGQASDAAISNGLLYGNTSKAGVYSTYTNCNVNSASPAACGSAPSGVVVVPPTIITYTVHTSAVTTNSRIIIMPIKDNSGVSGSPTCTAPPTPFIGYESGRVAGTSFTFTLPSTTGTSCWVYWIVN